MMNLCKETLVSLEEKFNKFKKLVENAVTDPETAPYTSKYAAIQQLQSMRELLERVQNRNEMNNRSCAKLLGMLGAIQLELGTLAAETEELSVSEKHYEECLQIIGGHTTKPEVALVTINLYNQWGILICKRSYHSGVIYLLKAEDLYKELKEKEIIPLDYMEFFGTEYEVNQEDSISKLEKAYTLTLYYLAQAYIATNQMKSTVYFHQTLQRQFDSKDYDHIDWALNTATLSQFFFKKNGFKQAKHHLSASLFVLNQYKQILDTSQEEGEEHEAKLETFQQRSADVHRCWIKYCTNLMTSSKERLIDTENIELTACTCTDIAEMDLSEYGVTKQEAEDLIFKNMDLSEYENSIGHAYLLTMDDAKKVFVAGQNFVKAAVDYHTLNTHASDYVEIMQDSSQLYDTLAFFSEDPDVRCKLYKRCADIMENVNSEINPQYYMRYCRQNWYRLGSTYSDMLDIKLEKLEAPLKATLHAATKVNTLVDKLVENFTKHIDSFRNASGELPKKIPEGEEKFFLLAYFHIAAKQTKYYTTDPVIRSARVQKSVDAYKAIIDYCKLHEEAAELVTGELQIAAIMVDLLQLKIARINNVAPPPKALSA